MVGNLALIDISNVKKKSLEYRIKVVLWVFVLHSAQYRRLETLSLCLCVTNPFESSCIRNSDWGWCRWVLHLLLSAHHSVGGPVC